MKSVFFLGNKRSGTTILMRILNLHPNIYITNESDLIWILYLTNCGKSLSPYNDDSPKGFNKTIKNYSQLLKSAKYQNVEKVFIDISREIMSSDDLYNSNKKDIKVVGDQKMYQHTESHILEFILNNFSSPYFIHIHRHPFQVIRSQKAFQSETGAPEYDDIWKNLSDEELLLKWFHFEKRVQDIKYKKVVKVFDIEYEYLIYYPVKALKQISTFLDVKFPFVMFLKGYLLCRKSNKTYKSQFVPLEIEKLMQKLGYSTNLETKPKFNMILNNFENFMKRILLRIVFK